MSINFSIPEDLCKSLETSLTSCKGTNEFLLMTVLHETTNNESKVIQSIIKLLNNIAALNQNNYLDYRIVYDCKGRLLVNLLRSPQQVKNRDETEVFVKRLIGHLRNDKTPKDLRNDKTPKDKDDCIVSEEEPKQFSLLKRESMGKNLSKYYYRGVKYHFNAKKSKEKNLKCS